MHNTCVIMWALCYNVGLVISLLTNPKSGSVAQVQKRLDFQRTHTCLLALSWNPAMEVGGGGSCYHQRPSDGTNHAEL